MSIIEFIIECKQNGSMLWVEANSIKLFVPDDFEGFDAFIDKVREFKPEILECLNANNIFSKDDFLNKTIFKHNANRTALSFAQERLWFIEQYEQGTNAYHIPAIFELAADTDVAGIKYALQQVVARHEVLRSTIEQADDREHGIQVLHHAELIIDEITLTDTQDIESLIKDDINLPFNLSTEYPIRVKLYKIEQRSSTGKIIPVKTLLLINLHHISFDGWSMNIFQQELFVYYQAYISNDLKFSLPALDIQYKDYAVWQRTYLSGPILQNQVDYWKAKLSNHQTLELLTDHPRPGKTSYRGANHAFTVNSKVSQQLRTLARECGASVHSMLLASINILLGKYTGQDDIVIGSPIANRHHRQTEGLMGFFVNAQVNRSILNNEQSFGSLIQQVHQEQIQAQMYQDLPFEKLVYELGVARDTSRHPVFQVLFGVQSFGNQDKATDKQRDYLIPFGSPDLYQVEKLDLSIYVDDSQQEFKGVISYATSLFEKDTIERLGGHYTHLLSQLISHPNKPYSQFSLLDTAEYDQIVKSGNATGNDYPIHKTIIDLFEEQVYNTPDNIAIVYEGKTLTYQQLNDLADRLAHHLKVTYDIKPNDLVGILLNRSEKVLIAMWGILKAGAAYVCIHPEYPEERKKYIINDTSLNILITQTDFIFDLEYYSGSLFAIDVQLDSLDTSVKVSKTTVQASDLAYVVYTSGTTGRPKGVMLEHKGLSNLSLVNKNSFQISGASRVLQYSSFIFDASVWEIFSALVSGAQLHIASTEVRQDAQLLCDYIAGNKITLAVLPPVVLSTMSGELNSLDTLVVAGEASGPELMNRWSKGLRLINAYGPTEGTVCATMHEYKNGDLNINIGKPIANTTAYVLDKNLNPLPIGAVGELHIGGIGVARGYLNRADLTADRFITDPFSTIEDKEKGHTHLYRTGDLVRWLPGGDLAYMGRNDGQVKIRGNRIETGEIESALLQVDGIGQSYVMVKERATASGSTKYLVGYYVPDTNDMALTDAEIEEHLSRLLPDYMVPGVYVKMEAFPLTINGKLDRNALPDSDLSILAEQYATPSTNTEKEICKIWQDVLGLNRVGISDDFFRIGGDSILSIQVASRIRQAGFNCQVRDIVECKTIARLVETLSKKSVSTTRSEQGALTGDLDLLPIQHWFIEKIGSRSFRQPSHWNQSFLIKVPELVVSKLETVFEELVNYHDALRIQFVKKDISQEHEAVENGQWKQLYQPGIKRPLLKILDVSSYAPAEMQEILTEWQAGFDLQNGALYQFGYLHGYDDGSARIFVSAHHMVIDAVSWRILAEDIKALYAGHSLPEKGSSYRQWAAAISNYAAQHSDEVSYWKQQLTGMSAIKAHVSGEKATRDILELDRALTTTLLQTASKAYNTEINDLLLTALAYALRDIDHQNEQRIILEGHGREDIDAGIDHSRTVGWFTTIFPVRLELNDTISESIISIKENLRKVPNKGIGFGAFAVDDNTDITYDALPSVSFNYLGQFDAKEMDWQIVAEGSGNAIHPDNDEPNQVNINGAISDGQLSFNVVTLLGAQTTQKLSSDLKAHLVNVIDHCARKVEKDGVGFTPSDFQLVHIGQQLLDSLTTAAAADGNEIEYIYPSSSLQQGFVYHALSQSGDDAYKVQFLYDCHMVLDIPRYLQAWEYCIAQYPMLRTAFNWEEDIIQIVYKKGKLEFTFHDVSHLSGQEERDAAIEVICVEDREQNFELTKPTMFRLHIIKQAADHYTILKCEHHSISDGWSGPILLNTLHQYYEELAENKTINVKQETAYLETQKYVAVHKKEAQQYWATRLADIDTANDINALLSHAVNMSGYKYVEQAAASTLEIKGEFYNELKAFVLREGITLNVIVQFIWHKLLQVYSAAEQTVIGTTVSGRDLPIEGIEHSVGLYINTLPLLVQWNNDNSILAQLQQIQQGITDMNTYSYADLAKMQISGERIFHSLFIYENYPLPKGGTDLSDLVFRETIEKVDYPLSIMTFEHPDLLTLKIGYDAKYLTGEKVLQHIATLEMILRQVINDPSVQHRKITLFSPEQYDQIVDQWNATERGYPENKTIVTLFEEQVNITPDKIAVACKDTQLTYRQLNEKSNQLATHIRMQYQLRTNSVLNPGTLIPLCMNKSVEMIIGILAIMKAGGAYVPMDPTFPRKRIEHILEDTCAKLILTQRHLYDGDLVQLPGDMAIVIDLSEELYKEESKADLSLSIDASALAYVIYTSGTTGKPKGVMVEHKAFAQFIYNFNDLLSETTGTSERSILSLTNYVFDIFGLEYALPLITGSSITLSSVDSVTPEEIESTQIIQQTPGSLALIANNYPHKLSGHICLVGGEALSPSIAEQLIGIFKKVFNVYGPAETVIWSTAYAVSDHLEPYIGKPLFNEHVYVLDKHNAPVPIGVEGELYIGGAGLARGYLNSPDLTAGRFIVNPFATELDKAKGYTRLYKTGDLVRWHPDGNLEYIGRTDEQVKINGYRIELNEIAHALSQIDGIAQSCVLAKAISNAPGNKYLVGYYVLNNSDNTLTEAGIQHQLSQLLPAYMVPRLLLQMESFPLTINGKLDKRALPDPDLGTVEAEYMAPVTDAEIALCSIWQQVLGLDKVGITDNFFKLGGNSISGIKASHLISKALECEMSVADLFSSQNIRALLQNIAEKQVSADNVEWDISI